MVAYTMTSGDLETGLGERTVVVVEKKSSLGWLCKVCWAILIVALCVAGALLFAWYWSGRPETMMQPGQSEARQEQKQNETFAAEPHHTLRRIGSKSKAAIHLEGSYDESNDLKNQVEWRKDQGQGFVQGGFGLEDNKIIIPQSGLYFVYTQASFRVSCSDEESASKHNAPLSHRIWRYSDSLGSKVSLMSAVRSACQRASQEDSYRVGERWYNAIYLGAVFQLRKGDRLWSETNQLAELESEGGKTFFGVFAL